MIHYNLSSTQLENHAKELLIKFDRELLSKTKTIDVYSVIEKCLDVPYDWKYITPTQSVLGMTAFNEGVIIVWDKPNDMATRLACYHNLMEKGFSQKAVAQLNGFIPRKIYLEKGTILIDASLTEGTCRGRENFTVMHEVFHQVLHKNCFRRDHNYVHATTTLALNRRNGHKQLVTSLDHIEYQANACAAAFLMPQELLTTTYRKCYSGSNILSAESPQAKGIIKQLAPEFNSSEQAMKYRLINLRLIR